MCHGRRTGAPKCRSGNISNARHSQLVSPLYRTFRTVDLLSGPQTDPMRIADEKTVLTSKEKLIGSALEAVVTISAPASLYKLLERHREDMRSLLIISGVEVRQGPEGNGNAPLHVEVTKAPGQKCERCWNYSVQVGASERYPTVCERCLGALGEIEREQPA